MSVSEFVVGQCYFMIDYYDQGLSVPRLDTYIFVGKNVLPSDGHGDDFWYFQEPGSYLNEGGFYLLPPADHGVLRLKEDALDLVFDIESAAEVLRKLPAE